MPTAHTNTYDRYTYTHAHTPIQSINSEEKLETTTRTYGPMDTNRKSNTRHYVPLAGESVFMKSVWDVSPANSCVQLTLLPGPK